MNELLVGLLVAAVGATLSALIAYPLGRAQGRQQTVYEELGERPVVVATQRHAPFGEPDPTTLLNASRRIAADLIEGGIVRGSHRAVTTEMIEKLVKEGDLRSFRNSAPFWFVEEYLEPRHQLCFVWFQGYDTVTDSGIGNPIREDTTRQEVEELIGASLDD